MVWSSICLTCWRISIFLSMLLHFTKRVKSSFSFYNHTPPSRAFQLKHTRKWLQFACNATLFRRRMYQQIPMITQEAKNASNYNKILLQHDVLGLTNCRDSRHVDKTWQKKVKINFNLTIWIDQCGRCSHYSY